MKTTKFLTTFFTVVLLLLSMTACGNTFSSELSEEALGICGSWAYIHDKETAVVVFREDGTAQYEDKDYSFECDSQFINLKDTEGETIQLRYTLDDQGMYLYKKTTYTFSGEGKPDGLVGEWTCAEKKWNFAFTDAGTFLEDGYFPGNYIVDDKKSTFKLTYQDQFEDTVCYFQVEDKKLHIEYPWLMVKVSTK